MKTRTANILSFAFIAAACAVAVVLYPALPEQIPTHWNAAGEVDDYTAKPWGVVVFPLIAAGVWALFRVIPLISPKGFRTGEFTDVINLLQTTIVGFTSGITVVVLLEAVGIDMYVDNVVPIAAGLLLVVIGNYLSKVRKNFFIGIRTPWTLASDEVWYRTHRLGGRMFVVAGLVLMASAFFEQFALVMALVVVVAALVPVVYSYLLYRRVEGFSDSETDDVA
jgi:uncharacterized membrane protein